MLPGAARKLAIPCVLLSIVGWLLYAAGFIVRNFDYRDSDIAGLDHAAKPDFFSFWLFLASPPLVYTFSILYTFWKHSFSRFFLHLFLPFFLIGAGGVLLVNGLAIYEYFIEESNTFLVCRDALRNTTIPLDMGSRFDTKENIHGDSRHVVIEFTGALASVTFYYLHWLLMPCFASNPEKTYI